MKKTVDNDFTIIIENLQNIFMVPLPAKKINQQF